jgi:hypothetical protein
MNLRAFCVKRKRRPVKTPHFTQGVNVAETERASNQTMCISKGTAQISQRPTKRPGIGNADLVREVHEWVTSASPFRHVFQCPCNEA